MQPLHPMILLVGCKGCFSAHSRKNHTARGSLSNGKLLAVCTALESRPLYFAKFLFSEMILERVYTISPFPIKVNTFSKLYKNFAK